MNTRCTITTLSLLTLAACLPAMAATVTPENLEAYEPFSLEVEIPGDPENPRLVPFLTLLKYSEDELFIGYQRSPGGFPIYPSPFPLPVEVPGLSPGTYTVKTAHMPDYLAGGNLDFNDEAEFSFTVAEAPPTEPVHAFFHPLAGRYFITSWEDEASELPLIDNGWKLSDFGFQAWPALGEAPATAVPVCRFYSSMVNSHFYTGDEVECALLQDDEGREEGGWVYEGIAFQALLPTNGACPIGTEAVWRLYNNRFAESASNHRFVASSETYLSMISDEWSSWRGEGIAFCSPQQTQD